MKPPQRTEAERIAGTLKKAERVALVSSVSIWGARDDPEWKRWSPTGRSLRMLGLIEFEGRITSTTRLTPLGRAVRQVILSQEQTDER